MTKCSCGLTAGGGMTRSHGHFEYAGARVEHHTPARCFVVITIEERTLPPRSRATTHWYGSACQTAEYREYARRAPAAGPHKEEGSDG